MKLGTKNLGKLKNNILNQLESHAQTRQVDGILVVHLDDPDEIEIKRRSEEVRRGLVLEDDCPLCRELASTPPEVVIYDEDSVLYLGQDQVGSYSSGHSRRKDTKSSPCCRTKRPARAKKTGEKHGV